MMFKRLKYNKLQISADEIQYLLFPAAAVNKSTFLLLNLRWYFPTLSETVIICKDIFIPLLIS